MLLAAQVFANNPCQSCSRGHQALHELKMPLKKVSVVFVCRTRMLTKEEAIAQGCSACEHYFVSFFGLQQCCGT